MVGLSFASWLDGTQEIWDIDRARYDALPLWSPAAAPIPLTLSDVAAMAVRARHSRRPTG